MRLNIETYSVLKIKLFKTYERINTINSIILRIQVVILSSDIKHVRHRSSAITTYYILGRLHS